MRLYEYECRKCERKYEALEPSNSSRAKPCEFETNGVRCTGIAERVMSGFSIGSGVKEARKNIPPDYLIIIKIN